MKDRVLVCPDKFKDALTAAEAASCMARGLARGNPQLSIDICPLADGGEGTLDVLLASTSGYTIPARVTGPLGEPVEASFGVLGDGSTAVIEMASASGLALIPLERRNPLVTTTRGTGELILEALKQGFRRFVIGVGGSGTCDGGSGMARALGIRFLDAGGRELVPGGGALSHLDAVDTTNLDARVAEATFLVASDVDNPLLGPIGAARVYAPQKGASPKAIEILETGLRRLAELVAATGSDVSTLPGAGAAGGLGFGLAAFLGADLLPGAEVVMQAVDFSRRLVGCRLVLTGEGRLDEQTARGKTVSAVARAAFAESVPVLALAGALGGDMRELHGQGLTAALAIQPGPLSREDALAGTALHLEETCNELGRLLAALASVNRPDEGAML